MTWTGPQITEMVSILGQLARREWTHGCGVGYLDRSGHVHVQAVPFVGGRAWVAGQLVGGG